MATALVAKEEEPSLDQGTTLAACVCLAVFL